MRCFASWLPPPDRAEELRDRRGCVLPLETLRSLDVRRKIPVVPSKEDYPTQGRSKVGLQPHPFDFDWPCADPHRAPNVGAKGERSEF